MKRMLLKPQEASVNKKLLALLLAGHFVRMSGEELRDRRGAVLGDAQLLRPITDNLLVNAINKHAVGLHQGSVEVESEPELTETT